MPGFILVLAPLLTALIRDGEEALELVRELLLELVLDPVNGRELVEEEENCLAVGDLTLLNGMLVAMLEIFGWEK
jgi:hypothetical protein